MTPKLHPAPDVSKHRVSGYLISAVWIFHGLYSKLLEGNPRHRLIVGRILGEDIAAPATVIVGLLEIALGIWILTGRKKVACAVVQTAAITAMNTLEISLAPDLLISAPGMVALNVAFLAIVWRWALALSPADPSAKVRRQ